MATDMTYGQEFTPEMLTQISDYALLSRMVVEGYLTGRHRSISHGYGGEFQQYRGYVPGDDTKYVDWKIFARQERLCTKVFLEETNMRCAIVLDASGSMAYQGRLAPCSKYRYGAMLAACLACLALKQGDQVALFVYTGEGVERVLSREQRHGLDGLLGILGRVAPHGEGRLDQAWDQACEYLHGRGLMVVISDFLGEAEQLERRVSQLRFNHCETLLMQVLDGDERELPFDEALCFVDSEDGREVPALASDIRGEYLERLASFEAGLADAGLNTQSDFVQFNTHEPLTTALGSYLQRRERHD